MDIADIQASVESFIDSILPSISELLLLLLILIIILGTKRCIALLKLLMRKIDSLDTSPIKRLEKAFEIKKFRPFLAIFIILLFARSVHLFAYQVGNLIPGNLSYSQPSLLLNSNAGIDIAKVWYLYPKAENLQSLNAILDIEIQKAQLAGVPYVESSYTSHEQRYIALNGRVTYLKFMILYIGVVAIYFSRNRRTKQIWSRAGILILLTFILIGYSLLGSIDSLMQMNIAKVNASIYIQQYEADDEVEEIKHSDLQKFEAKVKDSRKYTGSPFHLSFRVKI